MELNEQLNRMRSLMGLPLLKENFDAIKPDTKVNEKIDLSDFSETGDLIKLYREGQQSITAYFDFIEMLYNLDFEVSEIREFVLRDKKGKDAKYYIEYIDSLKTGSEEEKGLEEDIFSGVKDDDNGGQQLGNGELVSLVNGKFLSLQDGRELNFPYEYVANLANDGVVLNVDLPKLGLMKGDLLPFEVMIQNF